ncbi:hypothetical protein D187_001365 [Cystobacter fuscus DSM 2262]|uniref:Uncharacterized protein n=1 Tax=Cystobacter fuscus (strain ATCC 25194 / DSM 2262 / NBRC 100088 / M29) TaxID=1242864 RepID=S9PCA9_CYSF2|nr:hypothetical protein D187_001365 [Cystobacter fuscus DSM 2262]
MGGYVEQLGLKQTAVAARWLERWKEQGNNGPTWSDTTIDSHLSRALNDSQQGIRFFFQDRSRGALLLEVLQAPPGDHEEVFKLADSALRQEGAPARVVIDATGWAASVRNADTLFAELKRLLVTEGPHPIDLILLEEQYDRLPRSFDSFEKEKKLRLVQVKTPEQGWEAAQARAEEQGVLLSARRFPVFERWLAADFDGQALRIEPKQGLEQLRTRGALPSLEPVTHDLTEVVPTGEEHGSGLKTYSACEQHRWMRVLRSEEASARSGADARTRQGLARYLDITATSTEQERLDAKVRALQQELPGSVKIQAVSAEELKSQQDRAHRRQLAPTVLQVGSVVHLLNVPDGARLAQSRPWVSVHDIVPDPTALSLLLAEVDRWSEFDFLRDPYLDHLISRLDPEEKQRTAFLHARAGLLLTPALKPQTVAPEAHWRPLLEELLSGDPPAAQLRVHLSNAVLDERDDEHDDERDYEIKRTYFLLMQSRMEHLKQIPVTPLRHVPPFGDTLIDRTDNPLIGTGGTSSRALFVSSQYSRPSVLVANTASRARDSEFWLDAYEASESHSTEAFSSRYDDRYNRRYLPPLQHWQTTPLHIAPEYWEMADRELALAWLALRMALLNPRAIRLPDGAVLLQLGGSFFAELRVTRLAQSAMSSQVQACLFLDTNIQAFKRTTQPEGYLMTDEAFRISDLVTTHTVTGGYDFGARLPKWIHILGERTCADIRFRGSALFSEATPSPLHPAAVARIDQEKKQAAQALAAAKASADAEDRAAADDDDDYDSED